MALDITLRDNGASSFDINLSAGAIALVVQDALHGHSAEQLVLTQHNLLVVQDGLHGHSAENLVLVQHNILVVQDALHGHSAENLALIQHQLLAISDALHVHFADNVVLVIPGVLEIQDALHSHSAEQIVFIQHHIASPVTIQRKTIPMVPLAVPDRSFPSDVFQRAIDGQAKILRQQVRDSERELTLHEQAIRQKMALMEEEADEDHEIAIMEIERQWEQLRQNRSDISRMQNRLRLEAARERKAELAKRKRRKVK